MTVPPAKAALFGRKVTLLPPKVTESAVFASRDCLKCLTGSLSPPRGAAMRPELTVVDVRIRGAPRSGRHPVPHQVGELIPSETAAQEQREQSAVAFSPQGIGRRSVEQGFCLFRCQPVSCPDTLLAAAFHADNCNGRFMRKQAVRRGFARELAAYVSGKTPPKRSRWYGLLRADMFRSLVPLAAALLIAAGALWLVFQLIQMNDRLEEMRAERGVQEKRKQELEQQVAEAQGRYQQLAKELERERAQQEVEERTGLPSQAFSTGIVSFILRSGAVRDRSDTTRLVISVEAERVRLQPLFKTGNYQSYSAEIQTVEGRLLWERAGLKDRKRGDERVVTLLVPASLLSEGDYILILSGAASTGEKESVGEYYFRVDRK